ncbi:MAG: hypothetical protein ACR2O2_04120 [Ruegeria sp.]
MKRFLKISAVAAMVVAPEVGQAIGIGFGVRLGYRTAVAKVSDGVFEVVSLSGSAPVAYWCGAGDFAIRNLRTQATQRIYIWKAYGPSVSQPGKKAVQFSLSPPEGVDTTPGYSVTVKRVGENMTAGSAQGYCYDNMIDDFF